MELISYISTDKETKGCMLTTENLNFDGGFKPKRITLPNLGEKVLITVNPYLYDQEYEAVLCVDRLSWGPTMHNFKTKEGSFFNVYEVKSWKRI